MNLEKNGRLFLFFFFMFYKKIKNKKLDKIIIFKSTMTFFLFELCRKS